MLYWGGCDGLVGGRMVMRFVLLCWLRLVESIVRSVYVEQLFDL